MKHSDLEVVDVSNVTNISYMFFWYSENLESIKLNVWNKGNVDNWDAMFVMCQSLENWTYPILILAMLKICI